jgi:hypothetical protein
MLIPYAVGRKGSKYLFTDGQHEVGPKCHEPRQLIGRHVTIPTNRMCFRLNQMEMGYALILQYTGFKLIK